MDELTAGEENPFWQRFLQPKQYYDGDLNAEVAPLIEQVLNEEKGIEELKTEAEPAKTQEEIAEEKKKAREMDKIRRLDK